MFLLSTLLLLIMTNFSCYSLLDLVVMKSTRSCPCSLWTLASRVYFLSLVSTYLLSYMLFCARGCSTLFIIILFISFSQPQLDMLVFSLFKHDRIQAINLIGSLPSFSVPPPEPFRWDKLKNLTAIFSSLIFIQIICSKVQQFSHTNLVASMLLRL